MSMLFFASLICATLLIPSLARAQIAEEKTPATPAQAPAPSPKDKGKINQLSLEELRGLLSYTYKDKVVLLSFWSPYCGECLELFPMFSELQEKYGDKGFVVIGISLVGYPEKVWHSINRVGVNFPVFMGNADVFDAYQIHTLPTVIFIRKDGREEEPAEGHEANRTAFDSEVERLLEGRPRGIEDWFQWLLR